MSENISDSGLDLENERVAFEELVTPYGFDVTRYFIGNGNPHISHGIDPHVEYEDDRTGFLWFGYLLAIEAAHASQQARIDALEAKLAEVSKDVERMNYLFNGGWEVLQDPKYWTDNLNLRQVIDRQIEAIKKNEINHH